MPSDLDTVPVAASSYVSDEMRSSVGRELDRRVSFPITASDIRRWAVAIYYPEPPPQRFSSSAETTSAPEDFNPFAWLVAEPAGPPSSLRDPEEVLGIASPDAPVRLRGGMSVEYSVPMRAGDVITSVRRLGGYTERDGSRGRMLLTNIVDTWTNQRGEHVKNFEFTFIRFAESTQLRTEPPKKSASVSADPKPVEVVEAIVAGALHHSGVPTVGAELPVFVRATGPANWNRFAAVNDEFVAIHMDDDAGRAAGATGAFGMGNLQWAYMHNMLRHWMGDSGRITAASCQFRGLNMKDQTLIARGRVTAVRPEGAGTLVDLDLRTAVEGGPTLARGTATVALLGGA